MAIEFLKSIPASEAIEMIDAFPVTTGIEDVPLGEAAGRVTARDLISGEDIPPFPRSLVDGYALRAKETYGAKETSPGLFTLTGEVRVGEETDRVVEEASSIYVSTGAMVPGGADGVVMQEFVRRAGDDIEVTRGIFKGENICFKGEDIEKGKDVLARGTRLTPFHLGVLAALGISPVPVHTRPKISLISSGDEIVPVDVVPAPGKVRDINRYTLAGLLEREDADVTFRGIARDTLPDITEKLLASAGSDMILISGGSSKGERDFVTTAIEGLGGKVLFHGVNIKPGKPIIFADLNGTPLFGLPGHPASCLIATLKFVVPLLARMSGEMGREERWVPAVLTSNVPSSYGVEEYVRVSLTHGAEGRTATPVFSKSSVISSLSRASGYVVVPEGREGMEAGEEVEVYLFG